MILIHFKRKLTRNSHICCRVSLKSSLMSPFSWQRYFLGWHDLVISKNCQPKLSCQLKKIEWFFEKMYIINNQLTSWQSSYCALWVSGSDPVPWCPWWHFLRFDCSERVGAPSAARWSHLRQSHDKDAGYELQSRRNGARPHLQQQVIDWIFTPSQKFGKRLKIFHCIVR